MSEPYLIVGLGNPGKKYEGTRHNVGFTLVDLLAEKYPCSLREEPGIYGLVGKTQIQETKVILLKPTTYMNLSGKAIRKCLDYYKISLKRLLVIVDEVDLLLKEMRIKAGGSSGTHKGLKNIEQTLRSNAYARLRIGIHGEREIENLEDFVLKKFSAGEKSILEEVMSKALQTIAIWLGEGMDKAMNFANTHLKKHLGEST